MLPLLVLLVLTQVPCVPADSSVVCHCKQGQLSACVALRATDPKQADEIASQLLQAARLAEEVAHQQEADEAGEADEEESPTASASPEPPDCRGQNHHIISKLIAKALERHKTLRGLYKVSG
jgi:hypothetical protein